MGYTGEFIKPKSRKGKFNEYGFRWLNCDGGTVFRNSLSDLPDLMLLTHFGGSKLLEAFQDATFTAETVRTFSQPIELFTQFIQQISTIREVVVSHHEPSDGFPGMCIRVASGSGWLLGGFENSLLAASCLIIDHPHTTNHAENYPRV
jgi:hypothetical protein